MGRLGHVGSSIPLKRELFPTGFAGEVMQLMCETWNAFSLHQSIRFETRITAVFREALINAYVAAGRNWFITLEDPVIDSTFGTEEGRNDLNIFPLQFPGQKIFFTVECKRLRVKRKSGIAHLADEYVEQGMKRFVDGQYSKGLPCGGMIGYVMDNRVAEAFKKVRAEIALRTKKLKMVRKRPIRQPSIAVPKHIHSADTFHARSDGQFTIYHAFFGVRR